MSFGTYDVGENILLPYLLDRGIKKLDYAIISHFDSDHCDGILYIMEKIRVENVIITKQAENSGNLEEFLSIANENRVNVIVVDIGDKILIESNLYFYVLWPDSSNFISDNALNNNSLVCKLVYFNFSMLFTGDIEEVAEKQLIKLYSDSDLLSATVLKVAHHGSKTSSTMDFLELVHPSFALIGVGENNSYGHPNSDVLTRLDELRCLCL